MVEIPNFNKEKALEYLNSHIQKPFFNLLYLRDIERLPIKDTEYLEEQELLLSQKRISRLFKRRMENGAWCPPDKEAVWGPMHKSTLWILIFLGYLGVNGSVLPDIVESVDYVFDTKFDRNEKAFVSKHKIWGHFMQCQNAMVLRSLLLMGFQERNDVKEACHAHLEKIHGKEGLCKFKKGPQKKDRFILPCGWGLTKDLLFLCTWPENWRGSKFNETIKAIKKHLLSHNLAKGDYPRLNEKPSHKWFKFGYFRSYHSDIFEGAEALILSGVSDHQKLDEALTVIGDRCIDEVTWQCDIVPTWPIKIEKKEPSPWLTMKGLKLSRI